VTDSDRLAQRRLLDHVYRRRTPLLDEINKVAPWHALYRARTLELLSPFLTPATRMLDLAAGTGIFGLEAARHVSSLTLLDALQGMLDTARTNFKAAGLLPVGHQIRFLKQDLTEDDDGDSQIYDLIILTQALNFLAPLEKLFQYVVRHLAPTGLFYFDIDTAFRWAVIEALSMRPANALQIAENKRDNDRCIVGTDYFFYDRADIEQALEAAGLRVIKMHGLCYVSPFVHVFNASADFLERDHLDPRAAIFLEPGPLADLRQLDCAFESKLPPEAAGWMSFQVRRVTA
jgi:ubiquinone/menaquinone biosynthesis C-methylase UbiE